MSKSGTSIQFYLPLVTRISFRWYYQLTLSSNNAKVLGMDSHFCFDLYYSFPQHNKNHRNLKSPCKKWTVLLLYKLTHYCGRETVFIKKCYHVWPNPEEILSKSGKAIHVLHISIRKGITTVFISFRTATIKYYTKIPLTLQNCE